jgi:hypothetical protein
MLIGGKRSRPRIPTGGLLLHLTDLNVYRSTEDHGVAINMSDFVMLFPLQNVGATKVFRFN